MVGNAGERRCWWREEGAEVGAVSGLEVRRVSGLVKAKMKDKKENHTAEDVLRKFKLLLNNTNHGAWEIYEELAKEFGKKPRRIKSFWEKLWS